jgi:acyl-coenzyme A synthetase/AMP-(fatty) acid ligase
MLAVTGCAGDGGIAEHSAVAECAVVSIADELRAKGPWHYSVKDAIDAEERSKLIWFSIS